MKKIFQSILIGSLAIYFSACQKDSLPGPSNVEEIATASAAGKPSSAPTRVKTKTQGGVVRTYTYNVDGWLLESQSIQQNSIVCSYAGNTITSSIYYPGGALAGSFVYELNGIGLVSKATGSTLTGYYTYNLYNQLLTHDVYFTNGDVVKGVFYYSDNNLDSIVSKLNGSFSWKKTLTYLNKPNVLNDEVIGQAYLGAGSKHLAKSMVSTIADGTTTTENYNYKFTQGKLTKVETVKNGVPQPDTYYTYY